MIQNKNKVAHGRLSVRPAFLLLIEAVKHLQDTLVQNQTQCESLAFGKWYISLKNIGMKLFIGNSNYAFVIKQSIPEIVCFIYYDILSYLGIF